MAQRWKQDYLERASNSIARGGTTTCCSRTARSRRPERAPERRRIVSNEQPPFVSCVCRDAVRVRGPVGFREGDRGGESGSTFLGWIGYWKPLSSVMESG